MPDYVIQVALNHDSGLPEDRTINRYCLSTASLTPLADVNTFIDLLETLYNTIDSYLSSTLNGTMEFRAYDMADPTPRVPVVIRTQTLQPGSSAAPPQASLVVSFQGIAASGLNQARRRGRVYLGPLANVAIDANTGRPASAAITAIAAAYDVLLTASKAAAWGWAVWSDTDGAAVLIENGWVDNSLDVQRRRKIAPTGRTVFV